MAEIWNASYYRARYYDAAVGRFLSEDRIRFKSADVNFYSYVGDNPTNAADPMGLCKVIVKFTKVWGWLPAYHAYVVTVDPSGQMMGFRGGPDANGNVATTYGPYDKYFPDYEKGNPPCTKIFEDNKPCTRINYLLETALGRIEGANIPYDALGINSNSAISSALGSAGLPVPTVLPVWTPRWGVDPFANPFQGNTFSGNPSGIGGLPRH